MSPQKVFSFAVLVSLFAFVPGSSFGQSQQSAPAAQTTSSATTGAASSSASAQEQAAPLPNAKPGKVWTNEDIGALRKGNDISVVGKAPQNVSAATKPASKLLPPEKDPAWYRKQIAPLQAQIDKLDAQIAKLNAFLSGENVSDPPTAYRQMVPTPQDQLKQDEAKRQAASAKMEDLLDRARHNGIEPGALR
jgi:hypothetical protein